MWGARGRLDVLSPMVGLVLVPLMLVSYFL